MRLAIAIAQATAASVVYLLAVACDWPYSSRDAVDVMQRCDVPAALEAEARAFALMCLSSAPPTNDSVESCRNFAHSEFCKPARWVRRGGPDGMWRHCAEATGQLEQAACAAP